MLKLAVIPFRLPLPAVPAGDWDIFDDALVLADLISGQATFREPSELTLYIDTFDLLWDEALQTEDAVDFLWRLARDYEALHLADMNM